MVVNREGAKASHGFESLLDPSREKTDSSGVTRTVSTGRGALVQGHGAGKRPH